MPRSWVGETDVITDPGEEYWFGEGMVFSCFIDFVWSWAMNASPYSLTSLRIHVRVLASTTGRGSYLYRSQRMQK